MVAVPCITGSVRIINDDLINQRPEFDFVQDDISRGMHMAQFVIICGISQMIQLFVDY